MRCDAARGLLAEFQLGALVGRRRDEVAAHVAACEACRAELAALGGTAGLLDASEPLRPSRDLWQQVAAQLKPRATARAWWRALAPSTPRAAYAVAAAIVLIVALLVLFPIHLSNGPDGVLPHATDDDAALLAQWHAEASLTSALGNLPALALVAAEADRRQGVSPE